MARIDIGVHPLQMIIPYVCTAVVDGGKVYSFTARGPEKDQSLKLDSLIRFMGLLANHDFPGPLLPPRCPTAPASRPRLHPHQHRPTPLHELLHSLVHQGSLPWPWLVVSVVPSQLARDLEDQSNRSGLQCVVGSGIVVPRGYASSDSGPKQQCQNLDLSHPSPRPQSGKQHPVVMMDPIGVMSIVHKHLGLRNVKRIIIRHHFLPFPANRQDRSG